MTEFPGSDNTHDNCHPQGQLQNRFGRTQSCRQDLADGHLQTNKGRLTQAQARLMGRDIGPPTFGRVTGILFLNSNPINKHNSRF